MSDFSSERFVKFAHRHSQQIDVDNGVLTIAYAQLISQHLEREKHTGANCDLSKDD